MKDVEISYTFTVPRDEIEAHLTPQSIVEYQGTFDVRSVEETPDGWELTVESERMGPDSRSVLVCTETERGYRYVQKSGGVFEQLQTEVAVDEGEPTRVTVRSSFTFGGPLAFAKDWFAARWRRKELERFMMNLARELEASGAVDPEDTDGFESGSDS